MLNRIQLRTLHHWHFRKAKLCHWRDSSYTRHSPSCRRRDRYRFCYLCWTWATWRSLCSGRIPSAEFECLGSSRSRCSSCWCLEWSAQATLWYTSASAIPWTAAGQSGRTPSGRREWGSSHPSVLSLTRLEQIQWSFTDQQMFAGAQSKPGWSTDDPDLETRDDRYCFKGP